MATLLARGFDDVLTERMVSLSTAFAAEQAGLDPSVNFYADRNLLGAPSREELKKLPWMVWLVENMNDAQLGMGQQVRNETLTLSVNLYVRAAADLADAEDEQKALSRLSYLKEQAKAIIWKRANNQFGFSVGTIGKKTNARWQTFTPPNEDHEDWIVGGRYSVDVDFSWTPEDVTGTPIDLISVDTGKWSGLYTYP